MTKSYFNLCYFVGAFVPDKWLKIGLVYLLFESFIKVDEMSQKYTLITHGFERNKLTLKQYWISDIFILR